MAFRPAVLSYDDLEVDAFLTSDLKRIYVDAFVLQHRRRRYRFSLAHELAHHELHRPLYEASRVTSVRDWRAVQDAISEEDYAWFEFQANSHQPGGIPLLLDSLYRTHGWCPPRYE